MSDNKPKNPIAYLLARKKAMGNNFENKVSNDTSKFKGKVNTKGFGGPASVRKTGRGN